MLSIFSAQIFSFDVTFFVTFFCPTAGSLGSSVIVKVSGQPGAAFRWVPDRVSVRVGSQYKGQVSERGLWVPNRWRIEFSFHSQAFFNKGFRFGSQVSEVPRSHDRVPGIALQIWGFLGFRI